MKNVHRLPETGFRSCGCDLLTAETIEQKAFSSLLTITINQRASSQRIALTLFSSQNTDCRPSFVVS